ncbi:MAG: 4-(cytidine 5'-diphospho)-2-C-methyl-D-erythritol kinase [Bacteroidia bacterium]|nr:MAG: 4-(cytidine 5'-diphospho)-2-C-methyl-D-erythritol kinase [Bacteroidia bacterium]
MIAFPNIKINIGLNVIRKRNDGFHDLETIFFPVNMSDILEVVLADKSRNEAFVFSASGRKIDANPNENLCVKAYELLKKHYDIPALDIYLHKLIPFGAGLGGGSSDASFVLRMINEICNLNISTSELEKYALQLGSDCPFFIQNRPAFAQGRGEVLEPIDLDLKGKFLVIVNPKIHISTKVAFSGIKAVEAKTSLKQLVKLPIQQWKDNIFNDFEAHIFRLFPEIKKIKHEMYMCGADYASMTGSGSSVYGIFSQKVNFPQAIYADFL